MTEESNGSAPVSELKRRRSTRAGKLMRLIRRKESCKRNVARANNTSNSGQTSACPIDKKNQNKESKIHEVKGEKYTVNICVNPDKNQGSFS